MLAQSFFWNSTSSLPSSWSHSNALNYLKWLYFWLPLETVLPFAASYKHSCHGRLPVVTWPEELDTKWLIRKTCLPGNITTPFKSTRQLARPSAAGFHKGDPLLSGIGQKPACYGTVAQDSSGEEMHCRYPVKWWVAGNYRRRRLGNAWREAAIWQMAILPLMCHPSSHRFQ